MMQFRQGAHVLTADGQDVGTVDRLVIDPGSQEITHIVVRKGLLLPEDKVIPVHLVASTTANEITLKANANQVDLLPPFEEFHYISGDPAAMRPYDISGQVVPLYWYPSFTPLSPYLPTPPGVVEKNIPAGTVALKEDSRVVSSDDKHIGDVAGIFTSTGDRLAFFFIAHGLLQKTYKLIPANWIRNADEREVYLSVSSQVLEQLAEYEEIPERIDVQVSSEGRDTMKTCSDVMTRAVIYSVPEETVHNVAKLMKDNDIGPIPIVNNADSKKLVGMVTDRDLVLKVLAEGRDAQHTHVEEIMTKNLITCRESDNLDQALKAMEDNQVRRIPVVNNNNEIVGIIAQADIATRGDSARKTAEVVEEISKSDAANTGA